MIHATPGPCEKCGRHGHREAVPTFGLRGHEEAKLYCLDCASDVAEQQSTAANAALQRPMDDRVAQVMRLATEAQPGSPEGWLLGVCISTLILKGQDRASIQRIMAAVMASSFDAVTAVQS
jgi:hypothetical protein